MKLPFLLILLFFVRGQLDDWNLLVGNRQEWFCGACAVPQNWTLLEPSLIIMHEWPLSFTLISNQSYANSAQVELLYRRRACNLSAEWLQGEKRFPVMLPESEMWTTSVFSVPAYSGTVKLQLLTQNCTLMLGNITIVETMNGSVISEPGYSSEKEINTGEILIFALIGLVGASILVTIVLLILRERRHRYRPVELIKF